MFTQQHHDWLRGFRRNLFSYACAICSQATTAEDIFQEALVRAMSAKAVPAEPASFRVWMFRLLRNIWIDRLRADARAQAYVLGEQQTDEQPHILSGSEDAVVNRLAVRQAFMQLSKDHRDVLALVDIGGFSYEETAMLLSIPHGTVMSRVSRARAALLSLLSSERVVAFPSRHRASQ